ncbi:MAG TPA: 30S ribosomal protein S16 [Polyangia bacterium]|nr:30S ribosomal protein S16 [Polyangia bacterium]
MAVRLRLARAGAKKAPYYRVMVADSRSPRDGRFIEQVGIYDPTREPVEIRLDHDRIEHWIKRGALPSQTVSELIKRSRAGDPDKKGPGKGKQAA